MTDYTWITFVKFSNLHQTNIDKFIMFLVLSYSISTLSLSISAATLYLIPPPQFPSTVNTKTINKRPPHAPNSYPSPSCLLLWLISFNLSHSSSFLLWSAWSVWFSVPTFKTGKFQIEKFYVFCMMIYGGRREKE